MNPRELRIGNFVFVRLDTPPMPITTVKLTDFILLDKGKNHLLPIPLTPEWLERFGFNNIGTDDYHSKDLYKKDGCDWKYCLEGYFSQYFCEGHSEPATVGDINYVHQLQNTYFVVTGEELTIENPQ